MFHLGDIVEEIATKRRGKIDNMSLNHDHKGQVTSVNYWRVIFSDGQQPLFGVITDELALQLVSCPHSEPEPGFYPERGIMG